MRHYLRIIYRVSLLSFKQGFYHPISALFFIIGKLLRFVFFLFFLVFLFKKVPPLAGFDFYDLVFYFLIFNLIDSLAQWLMRGAYYFDAKLYNGEYDYTHLYPVNHLVYNLFAYIDPLDFVTLPVFIGYFIYFVVNYYHTPPPLTLITFVWALILSFLAVVGIHIITMAAAFKSPVTSDLLWIWRNLSQMGRVPTQIYPPLIYFLLTYILPVTLIINYPALVWNQSLKTTQTFFIGLINFGIFLFGLFIWQRWRKNYKSVSS